MAKTSPADFVKMYSNLVPREYWVESGALAEMNDDELDKVIERLRDEVRQEDATSVH